MELSVIIPTRNRSDLLAGLLRSLQSQTLPLSEFEVLVIDNGSIDATRQVVEFFQGGAANIRYFFEPTPGLHAGRHRGLREAKCDILVYADDDIEAKPTWLAAIADSFSDDKVGLVGGNNLPKFVTPPPAWLLKLWKRPAFGAGQSIPALSVLELTGSKREFSPLSVWGCNYSIRKKVLLDAGGFHPDALPCELIKFRGDGETHVSRYVSESGMRCLFHPDATVYHLVTPERMSIDYFEKRAFNQGISDSYALLRASFSCHDQPRYDQEISSMENLKRILRPSARKLRQLLTTDSNLRLLNKAVARGYREGFGFHQKAFHEDMELRAWVLKPHYLQE